MRPISHRWLRSHLLLLNNTSDPSAVAEAELVRARPTFVTAGLSSENTPEQIKIRPSHLRPEIFSKRLTHVRTLRQHVGRVWICGNENTAGGSAFPLIARMFSWLNREAAERSSGGEE